MIAYIIILIVGYVLGTLYPFTNLKIEWRKNANPTT